MGIMNWFRRPAGALPRAEAEAPALPEERSAEVGGLNFKLAVDAHMKWKIRLESYINGTSSEDLKAEVVCRDDQCPLGKWIYSRGGGEFGYSETFFDMKAHHAHFHRCAGDVLVTAQAGEKERALRMLQHGDYVRASERVKKLLAKLFVLVADGRSAIDSHMKWKQRLEDYVGGSAAENLSAATVSRDDQCPLGIWLKGDGFAHYGDDPVFAKVRETHARFHRCAGEIVTVADHGNQERALDMLEEGDYPRASEEVTAALVELFSAQTALR
jgi:hypothetical protein